MAFTETMRRWMQGVRSDSTAHFLRNVLSHLVDRQSARMLSSAGLAIKAGSSALAKAGSACYALADGTLLKIAANTDMPALSGTVTNATFNVFCFFIDSGGTVTSAMGTVNASTIGGVKFPPVPMQKAFIGFIIINPTGTGDFTGGTTALDDGTVTPNAVYVNNTSGFDPYAVIG